MGIHDNERKDHGTKRKTTTQLQSLGEYYSEDKYPNKEVMEEYAAILNLSYRQVRGWFVERRRKERKQHDFNSEKRNAQDSCGNHRSDCSTMIHLGNILNDFSSAGPRQAARTKKILLQHQHQLMSSHASAKYYQAPDSESAPFKKRRCAELSRECCNSQEFRDSVQGKHVKQSKSKKRNSVKNGTQLQVLFPKDYILRKIFRKDGPPLGVEFDPHPANAFGHRMGHNRTLACLETQRIPRRREVVERPIMDFGTYHEGNVPPRKYGIGKGLMTVWRATNSRNDSFPSGVSFIGGRVTLKSFQPDLSEDPFLRISKRLQQQKLIPTQRTSQKKLPEKRMSHTVKRKVHCIKDVNKKKRHLAKCKLLYDGEKSVEQLPEKSLLVDDEELELRELQAGPNPLRCSVHLSSNGQHDCPLCKDLLARFPPQFVQMKKPLSTKPWDSSPELVKKLFKVLQFLYTYASRAEILPFTLDEFAQAFHDKDSSLLGKIHVALLKLLLLDAEKVLSSGFVPRVSKDCRFLGFLHFVKEQEFDVNFWCCSLNSLSWVEILRQVMVAAGFGLKQSTVRRGNLDKEKNRMEKYGLLPLTLKGELFCILSEQGSTGMKVSELAKTSQIVSLNLSYRAEELEGAIYSTLSSDITLFEKIAHSAYRLRIDPHIKGADDPESEDDLGSVDDDSDNTSACSGGDDSDNSDNERKIIPCKVRNRKKGLKITEDTSIDESYSGEAWVLGLMEGEYSNLSIGEKLEALVALVDLTSSSSCRTEEPIRSLPAISPDIRYHGSGAKIKKATASHQLMAESMLERPLHVVEQNYSSLNSSKKRQLSGTETCPSTEETGPESHPLQAICLGSDRRYNSYWLFIGPCDGNDPGHRRVYFESSEDGHWEVIDNTQALCALLSVLDCRGTREAHLFAALEMREVFLCEAMNEYRANEMSSKQAGRSVPSDLDSGSGDSSSPISDVDNCLVTSDSLSNHVDASGAITLATGNNFDERKQKWDRLQAFDKWIWDSFYSNLNAVKYSKRSFMESLARCDSCHDLYWRDERHCRICHTTFELDFDLEERYVIHVATCREVENSSTHPPHKVLPSQLQALKAAIHAIEAGMPEAALVSSWTKSTHKLWVKRLRRTSSLPELLQVLADFVGAINEEWLYECTIPGSSTPIDEVIVYFQTMPQTTSAIALWMLKLDTLIAPHLQRLQSERTPGSKSRVKRSRMCTR